MATPAAGQRPGGEAHGDYARACLAIKDDASPVRKGDKWMGNKKPRFRGVLCVAGGQGGLSADLRLVPGEDPKL